MRIDSIKSYCLTCELSYYDTKKRRETSYSFPFMYSKQELLNDYARVLTKQCKRSGYLLLNIFDTKLLKHIKDNYKDYYNLIGNDLQNKKLSINTNFIINLIIKHVDNINSENKIKFTKFENYILEIIDYINKEGILHSAWHKTSMDYNDGLFESNSIRDNFYMFKENVYMILNQDKFIIGINKILPDFYIEEKDGNSDTLSNDEVIAMIIEAFFERYILFLNSPFETVSYYNNALQDHYYRNRECADYLDVCSNFFAETDILRYISLDCYSMRFDVHEITNFDYFNKFIRNRFDEDGTGKY